MLSLQLEQARMDQELIGNIIMTRGTKDINDAQFTDDTILLRVDNQLIAKWVNSKLDSYFQASGSKLNIRKNMIYNWNINPRKMFEISRILGIKGVTT